MQIFLNLFFCCSDLILFYICFEAVLIPMYLMIGTWGSRERRIHANYQFFLYTLCGSIFMLTSILLIHVFTGTTNLFLLTNYSWITFYGNNQIIQLIIWIGFFIGFAIKVPMMPFHLWLPEAHVEAPTGGSVLLAGLLLKLGGYGFIKIILLCLPYSNFFFTSAISICALTGVIYASFTTLRQNDLKKIIAYTSIAHMNLVILGLFTHSALALYGSIFLMISHGLVSSALFALIGMIYDRTHTRIVFYYGGLATVMPLFAISFFILSIANFGFPGTSSFIGEFLIFIGLFHGGQVMLPILAGIGFIISAFYSMWLFNRICFNVSSKHLSRSRYMDLNQLESIVLALFIGLIFILGLWVPESLALQCSF
jgi:proton-translocating NADH-quinone oxidoreductase chain M